MPYTDRLIRCRKNAGHAAVHLRKVRDQVKAQISIEPEHRQRVLRSIDETLKLLMASVDYDDDGGLLGIVGEYEEPSRNLHPGCAQVRAFEAAFPGYKALLTDRRASELAGKTVYQPSHMYRVWLHFRG